MAPLQHHYGRAGARSQAGFSLVELMIATGIVLTVTTIVTSALMQMTNSQRTIWNRTEMHSGVRSATELLQQEVGQAGRVALPAAITVNGAVAAGTSAITLSSVAGIFVNELLVVSPAAAGESQETFQVLTIVGNQIATLQTVDYNGVETHNSGQPAGSFASAHSNGAAVTAAGGFTTGVIPPAAAPVSYLNGSTGSLLKMYGDINGDGNMVYVEYKCDTAAGNLYRNTMAFDSAPPKPALTSAQILLTNITANPNNIACFQYQMDAGNQYVLDVAITLTVNTQQIDPITRQLQQETKALLNVSPRNVINAWELVGQHYASRVQATPATITALLP